MITPKKLAWIALLGLTAAILWVTTGWHDLGVTDFAAYWTASRQLLARQNPYALRPVLTMERQLGFTEPLPLIMRNPPWAAPFVLPLGLLSYPMAQRLWMLILLAAVFLSIRLLWRIYSAPAQPFWVPWLVAAMFTPLFVVLALGQMGPLILLGITVFILAQEQRRETLAGVSVMLIALKPHLVFLFWPAMFVWTVRERRWRLLLAFTIAVIAASAVAVAFDPEIFQHYDELRRTTAVRWQETPTPGGALCLLFSRGRPWLAWVPATGGTIWLVSRWIRKRHNWQWSAEMPCLLLVSLASTPYAWFFDQVVLLAAFLPLASRLMVADRNWLWPALTYLSINGAAFALIFHHKTTFWYAWTAPSWLLLYLWTNSMNSSSSRSVTEVSQA